MVGFTKSPFFKLRSDGTISVKLPTQVRETLLRLADELDESVETAHGDLRRLFPTAYPDNPERDAGYQIFSHSQLIEGRHQQVKVLRETVHAKNVSIEELNSWMKVVNDLRLVLGTKLDISEETSLTTFDPTQYAEPEVALHDMALYEALGEMLWHIVEALTGSLELE